MIKNGLMAQFILLAHKNNEQFSSCQSIWPIHIVFVTISVVNLRQALNNWNKWTYVNDFQVNF